MLKRIMWLLYYCWWWYSYYYSLILNVKQRSRDYQPLTRICWIKNLKRGWGLVGREDRQAAKSVGGL